MDAIQWMQLSFVIAAVVALIVFLFFRKYLWKLLLDYGVDFVLSSLDELLGSLAYRLDWGDWIAAPIIYWRTRRFVSKGAALFAAWEASGFFPIPFIPVVGDAVDWIANIVPTVFIIRLLPFLTLFGPYKRLKKRIRDGIEVFKGDSSVSKSFIKETEQNFEEAEEQADKENPVGAMALLKTADMKLEKVALQRLKETQDIFVKIDQEVQKFHDSEIFTNEETRPIGMQMLSEIMMPRLNAASNAIVAAKAAIRKRGEHEYSIAISQLDNADALLRAAQEKFNKALDAAIDAREASDLDKAA